MSNFINSLATKTLCPICKGWIFEATVYGFRTRVDPQPLDLRQEVIHRLKGRSIFQTFGVSEPTLIARDLWRINESDPRSKVFASHDCSTPEIFEPSDLYPRQIMKEPNF